MLVCIEAMARDVSNVLRDHYQMTDSQQTHRFEGPHIVIAVA